MIKFKSIAIIIAIMCSLLTTVNSAQAQIEIIDMYTPPETYTGLFYPYAYVDTDIPYDTVYWYIGDPDDPDNLKYVGETLGDGGATRAYFYPDASDCPGHVKGKKYRIAAKAWYYNRDTKTSTSDYDSRDFTVFQAIATTEVEKPPKKAPTVNGYSELTRQYYTGREIKIDCFVSAYNSADNPRGLTTAWSRFKHALTGKQAIERDHPNPDGEDAQPIGWYTHLDTLPHTDIDLTKRSYTSDAYVRLIVNGRFGEDNYFVGHSETFNSKDRPYDAPDE